MKSDHAANALVDTIYQYRELLDEAEELLRYWRDECSCERSDDIQEWLKKAGHEQKQQPL